MTFTDSREKQSARNMEVRSFILSNFLPGSDEAELRDDDLLFESGIIDSTGAMLLILSLEQMYDIQIKDEELFPRNFASVACILAFLERKIESEDHPEGGES